MLGKLLDGRYRVISVLGSGGFSQTYVASDTHRPSCPQCVVKHLKPFSQEPDFLQALRTRFHVEADALEKLGTHPQIPQLLSCFEDDGEFYLIQEFIEGHSLSEEVSGKLPEAEVVSLLHDVLEVLKFIHHQQVIHRDIKPNNLIRRSQDSKIVLIDFGAVKAIQTQIVNPQVTIRIGTPGYAPPEQEMGQPGFSSDLYALGMTAIQALTGVYPSQLVDPQTGQVSWRDQVRLSDDLAAILDRMVRPCHRERYQSAEECLHKLTAIAQTSTPPVTIQVPRIAKTQSGKLSPHLIGALILVLGLTLTGGFTYLRGQTAQATLAEVKRLQSQGKYQACLDQAKTLTQDFGIGFHLHSQAKASLNQCQLEIDQQKLSTAKQLATRGKLVDAITAASNLSDHSQLKPTARWLVESWTQRLLELGLAEYHRGKLAQAIAYAESIPIATPDYQSAQTTLAQWQKNWQIAEAQFQKAQQAFDQREWHAAIHLVQSSISENRFWQNKLAGIERKAKASQQAEVATRSQRITRTLERLNQNLDQVGKNALETAYPDKNYQQTAISELRGRRRGDRVTFRLTVTSQGWFWTTQTNIFDWEVLILQQQHVRAVVGNGKQLDSNHAEEVDNYFLTLAEQYL